MHHLLRRQIPRLAVAWMLSCLLLTGGWTAEREEVRIPDRPVLNDLKCLALLPYYVPRNIATAWWGYQVELGSFLDPSTRLPSGRKPSLPEKVGFATVVMPVGAVASVPVATVGAGVIPLTGHVADLFTSPFGRPLRFHRLDGSSFTGTRR